MELEHQLISGLVIQRVARQMEQSCQMRRIQLIRHRVTPSGQLTIIALLHSLQADVLRLLRPWQPQLLWPIQR